MNLYILLLQLLLLNILKYMHIYYCINLIDLKKMLINNQM